MRITRHRSWFFWFLLEADNRFSSSLTMTPNDEACSIGTALQQPSQRPPFGGEVHHLTDIHTVDMVSPKIMTSSGLCCWMRLTF